MGLSLAALGCRHESEQEPVESPPTRGHATASGHGVERGELGLAAFYSDALAGHRTASGERYDPRSLTAAHRTLPFGTLVRVVRVDNGRAVVVRINDRGPFGGHGRIIDLSRAAARSLGILHAGTVRVRLVVVRSSP